MHLTSQLKINAKPLYTLAFILTSYTSAATYTSGHGDIGVGYDAGLTEFEPHWHMSSGAIIDGTPSGSEAEFAPTALTAEASAVRNSPSGLSASLGVADGSDIFVMGSSSYQPNLGFAVEELTLADWSGNITLSLDAVTRPVGAEFALYTTNLGDNTVSDVVFSTYNSVGTVFDNSLPMTPGDHSHFQWGFTQVGQYDLELTWTGTHATDGPISTTETFTVTVIPEPSTLLLSTLALLGSFIILRRKQ